MVRNITEYLDDAAKKYPHKTAVSDVEGEISFCELQRQAQNLATDICKTVGNAINQPVAIYMKKGLNCIVAFLAVAYSGNFYSPIDIASPAERINTIMHVLKPKCIVTDKSGLKTVESISGSAPVLDLEEGILTTADQRRLNSIRERRLNIDPLYTLFTSGSTGVPKGVIISQAGVIDYTEWLAETFRFDQDTIFGEQAPFYFDNSILDIYSTIKNGATMVIIPENYFSFPVKLLEFMVEKRINTIFWVPSALAGVADSGVLDMIHLERLDKILFCGEVMPTRQYNIWKNHYPNALFANLYGPTEITDVCAYYIIDREFADDEALPLGKACKNMEIIVLNERNEPVCGDETGELCVRGIGVSMGYYANDEKTMQAFVQNPLNSSYRDIIYRTGDLVKYNAHGELVYICRKDFQIKHQGHRIELGEIETAVNAFHEVTQACVLYDSGEKKIVLFCALKENISEKEVYARLKNKVPRYMLPGKIVIMEQLPLNLNGKIDRVALQKCIMG